MGVESVYVRMKVGVLQWMRLLVVCVHVCVHVYVVCVCVCVHVCVCMCVDEYVATYIILFSKNDIRPSLACVHARVWLCHTRVNPTGVEDIFENI